VQAGVSVDISSHKSTMGIDMFPTKVQTRGMVTDLVVWDTAGQERYYSLTKSNGRAHADYFRKAQIAVVVFDLNSQESFCRREGLPEKLEMSG
jgi:GTPase SAR1 family protein